MKGDYEDIPDENMVFGYSSPENITFSGHLDSGYTIEEWNAMTPQEQDKAALMMFWDANLIDFWVSEEV